MKVVRFFILLSCLVSASSVSADLVITEIMYDAEGTDTDVEWIEVYNEGSTTIDIQQWYFRENEVNHRLTPVTFSTLASGDYAVIVQDQTSFESIFSAVPNIVTSSFSLNNTGETLAMLDQDKEETDSVTYTKDDGASGDGMSLQLISGAWRPRTPSPGSENHNNSGDTSADTSTDTMSNSDKIDDRSDREKQKFQEYLDPYIVFNEHITAGNPTRIQAGVYKVLEHRRNRKLRGKYFLNFGDGSYLESTQRIDVDHTFQYSGTYVITLQYHTSDLSLESQREPQVVYQKHLTILDSSIEIGSETINGSLTLVNNYDHSIDMSLWTIEYPVGLYTFPEYSMVAANTKLTIPYESLGMYVTAELLPQLKVYNSQGRLIAQGRGVEQEKTEPNHEGVTLGPNTSFVEDFLSANPSKQEVYLEDNEDIPTSQRVPTSSVILGFGVFTLLLLGFRLWLGMKK
jgi:hypothetical protein